MYCPSPTKYEINIKKYGQTVLRPIRQYREEISVNCSHTAKYNDRFEYESKQESSISYRNSLDNLHREKLQSESICRMLPITSHLLVIIKNERLISPFTKKLATTFRIKRHALHQMITSQPLPTKEALKL